MNKKIWIDIETTDLNANWGSCLCIGYCVEGEPIKVMSVKDYPNWKPWDDKKLLQEFLKVYTRDDIGIVIGHNIIMFDLPYLQARMSHHDLGVLPNLARVDTYFVAKSKFKIRGKSLGSIAEFLGCRYKKTPLAPEIWRKAGRGDEGSLDYIAAHNAADIRVTKQVYEKLAPLMMRHPVIGDYGACHNCGKHSLQKRGMATTVLIGPRQRFQCKSCGAWSTRKVA